MDHLLPQNELRNDVGRVLRQVEAGVTFTVTVAGRPVAELGPTPKRRWVSGERLAALWQSPHSTTMAADIAAFGGEITDPFTP